MTSFMLGDRRIGGDAPCFVIAEGGINHNGSLDIALKLVDEARRVGADAVKFQKRSVDRILTREARDAPYFGENSYGLTYGEHRHRVELSEADWRAIFDYSEKVGILCFGSAWDEASADFLDHCGAPLFKIASADLTNIGLLRHVSAKGKPVILSTGMSTLEEVDEAVEAVTRLNPRLAVLHCVSAYPFDAPLANLRTIETLQRRYPQAVIGYSGHEKSGLVVSLGAIAMGAKVLERHFTLDRHMKGSDHVASLEPQGFAMLVEDVRKLEAALGDGRKQIHPEEAPVRMKLAKSVTAARPIRKGDVLTADALTMKSPGTGLPGRCVDLLLGRIAQTDLDPDTQLPSQALQWPSSR